MSHKGIIIIIVIVSVVAIGGYSTLALIEQQPIQVIINSIQVITEKISLTDEAIVKNLVGDLTNERGRINTVNGSNYHVIINDGVGVEGTVPQE